MRMEEMEKLFSFQHCMKQALRGLVSGIDTEGVPRTQSSRRYCSPKEEAGSSRKWPLSVLGLRSAGHALIF